MSLAEMVVLGKQIAAQTKKREASHLHSMDQRSEREFAKLSPAMQSKVAYIIKHLRAKGWQPIVFHGSRTRDEQAQKIKEHHSATMHSLHVKGEHVAKDGHSKVYSPAAYAVGLKGPYSIKGEAADIVDRRWLWMGPCKDLDHPFWNDLGEVAAKFGLFWGGRWGGKFKDVAHVEMQKFETSLDMRHPSA